MTGIEGVLRDVITLATADGGHPPQERTLLGMRAALLALGRQMSVADAAASAGVNSRTFKGWRVTYPAFGTEVERLIEANRTDRAEETKIRRRARLEAEGLILSYTPEVPDPGTLTDFRMDYLGRPTPLHQQTSVHALEDLTNNYVFIFGPTGMGKDTLAMDYGAWRLCPDRTGLRCSVVMKAQDKAIRRLNRIGRYMTDPTAVREAPERTPGGQVPKKSLIEDFGPFKWEPGMIWEDGTEVHRPPWAQDAFYFIRAAAPEQDPNWQALGVLGSIQGDRIDELVCSDIFDVQNQKSPTLRRDQMLWFNGPAHSRLDESGRLVVIGNWLPIEHNYEEILGTYLEDAQAIYQETIGPGVYTKYDNGVAVVVVKAIYWDPATETEMSYWTERFPLDDSLYHPETEEVKLVAELSPDDIVDHGRTGWKRRRGLRGIRSKDPLTFKAMYQQERDQETAYSDFSDEVLAMAEDHHRSFRQLRAHEIRLLGVDPARKYGAAWVLLAVDKSEGVVTIADFFWGENLGYTGIKEKLILNPISRYEPSWLCYEDNIEGAALADTIVWKTIESLGISVWPHRTGMERGNAEIGPGALATWMREGRLRIPFQTAEDKARAAELKRQFKAWDSNPSTKRRRAGQAGYAPDDLCMATWVPWLKAAPMIDSDLKDTGIVYGVPKAIKRKFDLMQKQRQSRNALRAKNGREANPRDVIPRVNPLEAILSMSGEVSEED